MIYIKTFEQITNEDKSLVGGKAASLGKMIKEGLPIPSGFVVTTKAYKDFFNKSIPNNLEDEIFESFNSLKVEKVAVRSSAVAEDSINASWAGQLETYLNITKDNLIDSIKKCWASIHSERAKAYANKQGLLNSQQIAIVVQKMVNSRSSGVIFTINPVTKKNDEIMLEAIYGLGELLVQGIVTPYNFIINKNTLEIKSSKSGEQEKMLIYQNGENQEITLPADLKHKEILKNEEIKQLAKLFLQIEDIFKNPQDIEWAIEDGKIFILQSRPITTLP